MPNPIDPNRPRAPGAAPSARGAPRAQPAAAGTENVTPADVREAPRGPRGRFLGLFTSRTNAPSDKKLKKQVTDAYSCLQFTSKLESLILPYHAHSTRVIAALQHLQEMNRQPGFNVAELAAKAAKIIKTVHLTERDEPAVDQVLNADNVIALLHCLARDSSKVASEVYITDLFHHQAPQPFRASRSYSYTASACLKDVQVLYKPFEQFKRPASPSAEIKQLLNALHDNFSKTDEGKKVIDEVLSATAKVVSLAQTKLRQGEAEDGVDAYNSHYIFADGKLRPPQPEVFAFALRALSKDRSPASRDSVVDHLVNHASDFDTEPPGPAEPSRRTAPADAPPTPPPPPELSTCLSLFSQSPSTVKALQTMFDGQATKPDRIAAALTITSPEMCSLRGAMAPINSGVAKVTDDTKVHYQRFINYFGGASAQPLRSRVRSFLLVSHPDKADQRGVELDKHAVDKLGEAYHFANELATFLDEPNNQERLAPPGTKTR